MALIRCIECGHEVSDKAKACPHCGCLVSDCIKSLDEFEDEIEASSEEISDEKITDESNEIIVGNIANSLETTKKHKKKHIGILICILTIVGIIGVLINIGLIDFNDYESMSYEEKIDVITQFLGEEYDVNDDSIKMSLKLSKFLNRAELFKYHGNCTSGYSSNNTQGLVILDRADWISEIEYDEEIFDDIIEQLVNIYGEPNGEQDIATDFTEESVWKDVNEFSFVICGKNADNKIGIRWMIASSIDSVENEKTEISEEFKMFTEYEGSYEEKAEQYQANAEKCFLAELESQEKEYAINLGDENATVNSVWKFSGSFKQNENYYYCYTYSFTAGSSKMHVLIKYDTDSNKASVETPLEWIDADIDAMEEKLSN